MLYTTPIYFDIIILYFRYYGQIFIHYGCVICFNALQPQQRSMYLLLVLARTGYMPTEATANSLIIKELYGNHLSKQLLVPIQENFASSCLPHLGKLNINETVVSSLDLYDRLILVILQGHL